MCLHVYVHVCEYVCEFIFTNSPINLYIQTFKSFLRVNLTLNSRLSTINSGTIIYSGESLDLSYWKSIVSETHFLHRSCEIEYDEHAINIV